jgi:hypothetical protein
MDYLVACSNCYRTQPWNGDLTDTKCRGCGHHIQVGVMARALVHLFSTSAFDPTHDTIADEDGDELLRWLVGRLWGDAMRVGRHDWVYAGCPLRIDDVCEGIRQLDGAAFDSLGRVLSAGTPPDFLVCASEQIAAARPGASFAPCPTGAAIRPSRAFSFCRGGDCACPSPRTLSRDGRRPGASNRRGPG